MNAFGRKGQTYRIIAINDEAGRIIKTPHKGNVPDDFSVLVLMIAL